MSQTNKETIDKYNSVFARRLRECFEKKKPEGVTQGKLAAYVGVSAQAVSKWVNGDSEPTLVTIPKIAAYFGVTVDWLTGASDIWSQDKDVRNASLVTGLSCEAIQRLQIEKEKNQEYEGETFADCLSKLIDSELFYELIIQIIKYGEARQACELLLVLRTNQSRTQLCDVAEAADRIYNNSAIPDGIRDEALIYRELFNNNTMIGELLSDDPTFGMFDQSQLYEYRASRLMTELIDEIKKSARKISQKYIDFIVNDNGKESEVDAKTDGNHQKN